MPEIWSGSCILYLIQTLDRTKKKKKKKKKCLSVNVAVRGFSISLRQVLSRFVHNQEIIG